MTIDTATLKDAAIGIGKELAQASSLTADEKAKIEEWTVALGVALATGDPIAAGNYKTSLSTMLGVVEVRAAGASEAALLRLGNLALETVVRVGIAALAG